MSGDALTSAPPRHVSVPLARHRGLLIALAVLIVLFGITDLVSAGSFNYFELSFLSSGGATLAIAAIGETSSSCRAASASRPGRGYRSALPSPEAICRAIPPRCWHGHWPESVSSSA